MEILNHRQVQQKVNRLAIEIIENNFKEKEIILAGVNNNGLGFAEMLKNQLNKISTKKTTLAQIRLNPASPISEDIELSIPLKNLRNKAVIVVDDVANTGRTIFYACKPLMHILPKKIEAAVLVNRTHKSFPLEINYVGLSLATTLKDNIDVRIKQKKNYAVYLN